MSRVVVLRMGSTLPELRSRRGDYPDWILAGLGVPAGRARVVSACAGEEPPPPDTPAAVVVTGSSAFVSDREAWSERAGAWLVAAVEAGTPVLGICYGHQLLAQALGGRVGRNPNGREIGCVAVEREPASERDALLGALPQTLHVNATHLESVLELPPGAVSLARSGLDPNHAFAAGPLAWGVQFHPEFDADVMRAYLEARSERIRGEGLDPDGLLAAVRETPDGGAVLRRFSELAGIRSA